ncbi:MAG: hypothetical protein DSY81_01350 [Bacillota bacterium]|nr:MAG: hypothetical protein DSY81_01350 [Bacillota bacterium]
MKITTIFVAAMIVLALSWLIWPTSRDGNTAANSTPESAEELNTTEANRMPQIDLEPEVVAKILEAPSKRNAQEIFDELVESLGDRSQLQASGPLIVEWLSRGAESIDDLTAMIAACTDSTYDQAFVLGLLAQSAMTMLQQDPTAFEPWDFNSLAGAVAANVGGDYYIGATIAQIAFQGHAEKLEPEIFETVVVAVRGQQASGEAKTKNMMAQLSGLNLIKSLYPHMSAELDPVLIEVMLDPESPQWARFDSARILVERDWRNSIDSIRFALEAFDEELNARSKISNLQWTVADGVLTLPIEEQIEFLDQFESMRSANIAFLSSDMSHCQEIYDAMTDAQRNSPQFRTCVLRGAGNEVAREAGFEILADWENEESWVVDRAVGTLLSRGDSHAATLANLDQHFQDRVNAGTYYVDSFWDSMLFNIGETKKSPHSDYSGEVSAEFLSLIEQWVSQTEGSEDPGRQQLIEALQLETNN